MKHTCQSGWVVVPVISAHRACRMGRWDNGRGKCVPKSPRIKPRGSCPPPPLINNGYFLSELAEKYNREKPYVLPVSGAYQHTYEVNFMLEINTFRVFLSIISIKLSPKCLSLSTLFNSIRSLVSLLFITSCSIKIRGRGEI